MSILFQNVTAVLMDEARTVLRDGYVAVKGTEITYVGQQRPGGSFNKVINCEGKVMMPGFVNAHTHVPMTLMRGFGGGCDLHTWLNEYIFPTEAKWDDRSIRCATALGLAEMIASGVTCIADMYDHCNAICEEVVSAGLSANIARGTTLFADELDPDTFPGCVEQRELAEQWHGRNDGQILVDASIHGEYTSNPKLWDWTVQFAKDKNLGIHLHLSETKSEHEECIARNGLTPAATFEKYGVFDVRTIAAHCVFTTPEDWEILARHGVSAIHNPMSNLKLGSGIAPTAAMRRAGVNVALGTDGVSSNNATDLFADMKLAALLAAGSTNDPMAMTAWEALEMATVRGAQALGRNTGRIAAGCTADLILIDFTKPNLIPCHDVAENLVYSAHGADVCLTMARGKILYKDRQWLTIDLERINREIERHAMPRLFGR